MTKHIASVSWGKDSLAMLLLILEKGLPLDEVIFYDTGAEFESIYQMRDKFIAEHPNIKVTTLRPKEPFFYSMFARPVKKRGTNEVHKHGYGWCGGVCRWGTSGKTGILDKYATNDSAVVYVGIAYDEPTRHAKLPEWKTSPIYDAGMTEADCLAYCYERGYDWLEGGGDTLV